MPDLKQLTIRLRKHLPGPVRRLARIGRLAVKKGKASPRIAPELIEGCRVFASRFDMAARLPKGGTIAEIGTDKGVFAAHMLRVCEPACLHLFDLDFGRLDPAVSADPRVMLHQGATPGTLTVLAENSLDWAYIDGDHSFSGAAEDAAAVAKRVRPGGYLVFNDFAHADPFLGQYGVHRAVMEFVVRERWPIVMLAYHPSALYDVALRRPLAW
jgi:predicted O-methyltransferase YrrM